MLSVLISGKAATAVFTFVRPENNLGTSTTPSGGLVAKAYKMFPNAHPHIEKYVSDSDEKDDVRKPPFHQRRDIHLYASHDGSNRK